MRGLVLVAALLLAVPLGASAQTGSSTPSGSEQPFMADGEVLLKKLTARQFDHRLPATNLKDWLSSLLSKRAKIDWSTTDCGDEGGGPDSGTGNAGASDSGQSGESTDTSGSGLDSPLCTEAQALFYGRDGKPSLDRYVVVQLLVGTSRKRFIGALAGGRPPEQRLPGTLASVAAVAVLHGADVVRVHDVGEAKDALAVADAIARAREGGDSWGPPRP